MKRSDRPRARQRINSWKPSETKGPCDVDDEAGDGGADLVHDATPQLLQRLEPLVEALHVRQLAPLLVHVCGHQGDVVGRDVDLRVRVPDVVLEADDPDARIEHHLSQRVLGELLVSRQVDGRKIGLLGVVVHAPTAGHRGQVVDVSVLAGQLAIRVRLFHGHHG